MSFERFVDEVYVPTDIVLLAKSTQERSNGVIKNHLMPFWGKTPIRDISALSVQRYILGFKIAPPGVKVEGALSREGVDKIRDGDVEHPGFRGQVRVPRLRTLRRRTFASASSRNT